MERLERAEVRGDVLADRGVRAPTGLDRGDARRGEGPVGEEERGVLGGEDVVCDGGDVVFVAEALAQGEGQRSLSRAYGSVATC